MSNEESSSEIVVEKNNNEVEYDLDDNDLKSPVMILSIDVGNGKVEELKLYSLESPKKDIYKFCTVNKLDYDTMDEIIKQVEELIRDRLNESNQNENEDKNEEEKKEEESNEETSKDEEEESNDEESKEEEEKKENDNNSINKNEQNKNSQIFNINDKYVNNKSYNHKTKNNLTKYNLKKQVKRNNKINNSSSVSLFQYQINDKSNYSFYSNKNLKNSKGSKLTSLYSYNNNNTRNSSKKFNSINKNKTESTLTTNLVKETEQKQNFNSSNGFFDPSNLIENDIIKTRNNKYYISNKTSSNSTIKNSSSCYSLHNNKNVQQFLTSNKNLIRPIFNNRGLYDKNIKYKEKERKKLELLKNNIKEDEDELLPFKPKVNKISNEAYIKRKQKGNEFNNSKVLKNYKTYQEEKRKEFYKKQLKTDPNEINLTFKPKINKDYQYSNNEMTNSKKEIFNKLYEYNNLYKEKRNYLERELENKFPFKPSVNNNNKIKDSFSVRLQQYENNSRERLQKLKENIEEEMYNITKPDLFNNTHSMNFERTNSKNDPYTILYLYNDIYKENKKQLENKFYKKFLSNPKINKSSTNLINDKKQKSFKKIFNLLDSDGDGIIKSTAINKNKIPKNIQLILNPIFKEIRDDNETLNEKEFISVCEQLYNFLPFEKKKIFSNFCKGNKVDNKLKYNIKYPFKPKINKSSERIDKKLNHYSLRDYSKSSKSIFLMNNTLRNNRNLFFKVYY